MPNKTWPQRVSKLINSMVISASSKVNTLTGHVSIIALLDFFIGLIAIFNLIKNRY
jgi:hypothetical protein